MKKQIVKNNYLTKDYLDKRLDKVIKDLIKYIDLRLQPIEEPIKEIKVINKKIDWIIEKLDWLVGKYQKFGEEHMILTNQYAPINEKLESHEIRITSLEQRIISS